MLDMLSLAALSGFKAVSGLLRRGIAVCACVQHHEQVGEGEVQVWLLSKALGGYPVCISQYHSDSNSHD